MRDMQTDLTQPVEDARQLEQRFRQRILYAVSGAIFVLSLLLIYILIIYIPPETAAFTAGLNVLVIILAVVSAGLARAGRIRSASYIIIYLSLAILFPAIASGGPSLFVPVFLVGVLLSAGLLLGPGDLVVAAVVCFVVFITSWLAGINNWLPLPRQMATPDSLAVTNGVLMGNQLVLAAVQIYLFVAHKNTLVVSAQRQAAQLRASNADLTARRAVEQQSSQEIERLATILASLYTDQSRVAQRQAELVSEVATTSQEMDRTAETIATSAQAVADAAATAVQNVEQGHNAVAHGVESFETLRRRVEQITDRVRTLTIQVARIGEVTGIIGDIADETNLLAINATIEAAGAREYGRRFAAVADEVQRLATRAAQAVEEVQEMIGEVNGASRASLSVTEDGLREVAQGAGQVEQLRLVNDQIERGAVETAVLARSIAQATGQQRQASEEIVSALLQIDNTANQVARISTDVAQLITALRAAAQRLTHADTPAPQPLPTLHTAPMATQEAPAPAATATPR